VDVTDDRLDLAKEEIQIMPGLQHTLTEVEGVFVPEVARRGMIETRVSLLANRG